MLGFGLSLDGLMDRFETSYHEGSVPLSYVVLSDRLTTCVMLWIGGA